MAENQPTGQDTDEIEEDVRQSEGNEPFQGEPSGQEPFQGEPSDPDA
jgi:hypothetical protein